MKACSTIQTNLAGAQATLAYTTHTAKLRYSNILWGEEALLLNKT